MEEEKNIYIMQFMFTFQRCQSLNQAVILMSIRSLKKKIGDIKDALTSLTERIINNYHIKNEKRKIIL